MNRISLFNKRYYKYHLKIYRQDALYTFIQSGNYAQEAPP